MSLSVQIEKDFGSFQLNVAFEAGEETLALLGASGCGKSMTLRCIAGIVKPDKGRIVLNGETLFDSEKGIDLPPQKRRVGLLFQNYALFPNMTVEQNILAGMRRESSRAKKQERLHAVIEKFCLQGLEKRRPAQLSGGQQQRVALARILVSEPHILMLDEPFSALDSFLRWKMEREAVAVIREFGGTALLVSHNRDEVYRISDRVAVYNNGRIDVLDDKAAVFAAPPTYCSALLTGCKNLADAVPGPNGLAHVADWGVDLAVPGGKVPECIGIRSHDMAPADAPGENVFPYEVAETIEDTFNYVLMIRPAGAAPSVTPLRWEMTKEKYAALPANHLVSFPKDKLLLLKK